MSQLFVGLSFIVLAILVIVTLVTDVLSDLGGSSPTQREQDDVRFTDEKPEVVIRLRGSDEPPPPPIRGQDSVIPPADPLSRREREQLDAQGYLHYRVAPYETLSAIAQRYLGRASLWKAIQEHNPGLTDPRHLREGTVLKIPVWLSERR